MITTKKVDEGIDFYWSNGAFLGTALLEVDGAYYFLFHQTSGLWSDTTLRLIADKLMELNLHDL